MPSSPSRGSVVSSGRRHHELFNLNSSDKDTSSPEHSVRNASLATPSSQKRKPVSLSQDEQPDTQAEERGGAVTSWSVYRRPSAFEKPSTPTSSLSIELGVSKPSELEVIYMEDLLEEGVSYEDAAILLQGYQSSGAARPFYPGNSEYKTLLVKHQERIGTVAPKSKRGRRAQPA